MSKRTLIGGAVVVALLLAGSCIFFSTWIFRALNGVGSRERQEITNLEMALKGFYNKYKFYPPSRLRLCDNFNTYQVSPSPVANLDDDSKNYLLKMFPNMQASWSKAGIDWNGNGNTSDDVILHGDQCLVFFLGGIKTAKAEGIDGFSTNPENPGRQGTDRTRPYFKFQSERLKDLRGNGYFSYLDRYNQRPFLYFSAYNTPNGYNRYGTTDCPDAPGGALGGMDVWPYQESAGQFLMLNTFQIISAGRNKQFGPGTVPPSPYYWNKGTAADIGAAGSDDQANFSRSFLNLGP